MEHSLPSIRKLNLKLLSCLERIFSCGYLNLNSLVGLGSYFVSFLG